MENLKSLVELIGGHLLPEEEDGPARRMQLVALAVAASAVLCAGYGFAAGGTELATSMQNLYRMPLIVILSSVAALPAGLLTWKLIGADSRPSDLVLGAASGTLTASLVLAVAAPLVALYYHSSFWLGAVIAIGSAALALAVGLGVLVRTVWLRSEGDRWLRFAPVMVMIVMQLLTLPQMIGITGGVLAEHTPMDGGLEAFFGER